MQTVDKALLLKKVPEEVDDEIGEWKARIRSKWKSWPRGGRRGTEAKAECRRSTAPHQTMTITGSFPQSCHKHKPGRGHFSRPSRTRGHGTSWLYKRDLALWRTLYPINKSDSIILYQNNILAFNEHNCQYPESRIMNHYLLLPTLSNFLLRRQGWMGSLIWIRNTVTCSALCLLTLCGGAGLG